MRLQAIEAQIAVETKLAGVRELGVQVCQLQVQVAEKTLALMQSRYNEAADQQERLLKEKAADEANRAQRSEDPLEQFRARRRAELLDLEAQVIKLEQALATSPPPSLDEQRSLADHAAADFARIKELLDDGRVSRLDAIRLNNDFRRIGPERDRLLRNEMATAELRLQYYEDALTGVEIDLLQDSLHDHYELELLKERLHPSRRAEGERILADLERIHRALLVRRRSVLERLAEVTGQTHDQIARRLAILDEEYGFIRTHIFWVRDQEPVGPGTITQAARECQHLLKAMLRLGQESLRPQQRGRPSAEFVTAALGVLVLPFGLVRLRRLLKAQLGRDLPSERTGTP
jgi:potassium efflux system protein